MAYVYLLKSLKDRNGYIGSTIDLNQRIEQHNAGRVKSTKNRRPLELKGYQIFKTIEEAAEYENRYKQSHDSLNRAIKSGKFKLLNGV